MRCNMNFPRHNKSKSGGALVSALLFAVIAAALAGSYVSYSSQDARATQHMIDYQKSKIAAECGLEYGILALRDIVIANQLALPRADLQVLLDAVNPPSDIGGYRYVAGTGASAFRLDVSSDVNSGVINRGIACIGSVGETEMFTITVGARNPDTGAGSVLEQRVQAVGLFLIRYGVFYERDLEINPGADMFFRGPVHCNGDMYLAPDGATLAFKSRLTSHGELYRHRKDSTANTGTVTVDNKFGTPVTMTMDSTNATWMIQSLLDFDGRVLTKCHGVQHLSPPIATIDTPHDIIERAMSITNPLYHAATEAQKFENKACLRIYVSNKVITAVNYFGSNVTYRFTNAVQLTTTTTARLDMKDANGGYLFRTNGRGAFGVTNTFYDDRENRTMLPIDVYVDQLTNTYPEAVTGSTFTTTTGKGVIYVTRWDPDNTNGILQPCIRVRNAETYPAGGLSIITDLPIYMEGNINTNNVRPALIGGDSVTFLSRNWQDALSSSNLAARQASNTTYNVVVMTGNSETTWGVYNGGLENNLRFLESWTGDTCYYRGSIINLWGAEHSTTNPWSCNVYYDPPTRDWGYDDMYLTNVPPGMTRVFGVEEISWSNSTWQAANFL